MPVKKTVIAAALGVVVVAAVAVAVAVKVKKDKKESAVTKDNFCDVEQDKVGMAGFVPWASESKLVLTRSTKKAQLSIAGTISFEKSKSLGAEMPKCVMPDRNYARILEPAEYTLGEGVPATGTWLFRYYKPAADAVPTLYLHWSGDNADGSRNTSHFWPPQFDGKLTLKAPIVMDITVAEPAPQAAPVVPAALGFM